MTPRHPPALEALYGEAVDIADRARGWFDGPGVAWRQALSIADQARVSVESLATTARLMAVMSWLLDPAHAVAGAIPGRLVLSGHVDDDLPGDSPLVGVPGGDIALASRQLVARARALSAPPGSENAGHGLWR